MSDWSKERLVKGLKYIDTIVNNLDTSPNLTPKATELYRKAAKEGIKMTTGYGLKTLAAGSVHVGSRMESAPIDAKTIANAVPRKDDHITESTVIKVSKQLRDSLDLGAVLADPADVATQAADELNASDQFREHTLTLINAVKTKQATVGVKASTIAGASIYVVSLMAGTGKHGYYTQSEISRAVGVSEVSIRNTYRQIAQAGREADALGSEVQI